jgi:hypothetical protein
MAARTGKIRHDEETRLKIQASQLINRINNHIYTYPTDPDFAKKYMDQSQVRAALGLLSKILPDLKAMEHTGEVTQKYVMALPAPIESAEQWQSNHTTLQ